MIIKEGEYYRNRDGFTAGPMRPVLTEDKGVCSPSPYVWLDEDDESYTADGAYNASGVEHTFDLVEEVANPHEIVVADSPTIEPLEPTPVAEAVVAIPVTGRPTHVYLSGPMKGYPDSNYPLFTAVAAMLRKSGYVVYNPAEFTHTEDTFPLRKAFAEYSRFICEEADAIVLLPAWEKSLGVSAELALAKNCGLIVVELKDVFLSASIG